jgi:hypothetical protein
MSIDRILIARILFTLMTAGYAALRCSPTSIKHTRQIQNGHRMRGFMWSGRF